MRKEGRCPDNFERAAWASICGHVRGAGSSDATSEVIGLGFERAMIRRNKERRGVVQL